MKTSKRIKQIVNLTVHDWFSYGFSTSDTDKGLKSWLCSELAKDENIEDLYTYEITIKVLKMLNALEIVDMGSLIDMLNDDNEESEPSYTKPFNMPEL